MKYRQIFTKFWFWICVAIYCLLEISAHLRNYGNIFVAEVLGYIVGSFIIVTIIMSLGFGFYKIVYRKHKR